MRKIILVVVVVVAVGGWWLFRGGDEPQPGQTGTPPAGAARGGPGGGQRGGSGGGRGGPRPPMTVELAPVTRGDVTEHITLVGNLIGAATVEVVPKVSGRLQAVTVRIGDAVRRGQRLAKLEDREIFEQVKQAQASHEVARASIRQREADLKFAETNLERSRSLYGRQLLPKQTLDDAEAKFQAAAAGVDLARAQYAQARARLEELQITLANTAITSPVDGFVGKRYLDAGGFASTNTPVVSVVEIRTVRLVANLVEKDLRRVRTGVPAVTEVDAYPGETFVGRVARVAPVLDPQTRTATMEIEVPNPGFRLKPGMYARVRLTVDRRDAALVIPRNALVHVEGKHGVFLPSTNNTARFREVQTGLQDETQVEITGGLGEGDRVITTGAAALRDGDPILLARQRGGATNEVVGARGRPSGRS